MEILEAADIAFFRIAFNSHSKTVRESYYLETGKLKIRHIIAKRRFLFHQNIVKKKDALLLKNIYNAQKLNPNKNGDFYSLITTEKEFYNVSLSDEEICKMSKAAYKKYVNEKVHFKSFSEMILSTKSKIQN